MKGVRECLLQDGQREVEPDMVHHHGHDQGLLQGRRGEEEEGGGRGRGRGGGGGERGGRGEGKGEEEEEGGGGGGDSSRAVSEMLNDHCSVQHM